MIFKSPGEIIISINGFSVYYYGVIMALACFIGVYTAYRLLKKYYPEENYKRVWDFATMLLIFGILGARLYYCLLNPIKYFGNPLEIFNIREGGLSIHGALITGIAALIILSKKYKLGKTKLLDVFACGTALAQSFGRWGNFFNSEAFGYPTDLPWKLFIPPDKRPIEFINSDFFHPTFLYESILDFVIFIILYYTLKTTAKTQPGIAFYSYLMLYSIARIFIETIRVDSVLSFSGLHIAHIISLILFIVGVAGILHKTKCKA